MSFRRGCLLSLGAITLIVSPKAQAATFTWKGAGTEATPTTGNWNVSTNWTGGVPSGTNPTLIFQGSGGTAYTATNNLSIADSTIQLNSSASVTETIAGNNFAEIQSLLTISQLGSGAFSISNGASFKSAQLTLDGNGVGVVTLSGAFTDSSGGNKGALVKNGTSTFILTNSSNQFGELATLGAVVTAQDVPATRAVPLSELLSARESV